MKKRNKIRKSKKLHPQNKTRESFRRLSKNLNILKVLEKAKPKLRTAILKNAKGDLIKTLCEFCINTLNGNHKIKDEVKKKLKKYCNTLRSLSCKKRSLENKRKILIQKGGFLSVLLNAILPLVSGIVGSYIK